MESINPIAVYFVVLALYLVVIGFAPSNKLEIDMLQVFCAIVWPLTLFVAIATTAALSFVWIGRKLRERISR